jgi:hypothetical protein
MTPRARAVPTVRGMGDEELKKDLGAVLEARKDLGTDYESALVESFLAKVDARLDGQVEKRVRRELAEQTMDHHRSVRTKKPRKGNSGLLAAASLGCAIPLSAIGATQAGLAGLLITWVGVVGVNVANAWPPNQWFGRAPGKPSPDWED